MKKTHFEGNNDTYPMVCDVTKEHIIKLLKVQESQSGYLRRNLTNVTKREILESNIALTKTLGGADDADGADGADGASSSSQNNCGLLSVINRVLVEEKGRGE